MADREPWWERGSIRARSRSRICSISGGIGFFLLLRGSDAVEERRKSALRTGAIGGGFGSSVSKKSFRSVWCHNFVSAKSCRSSLFWVSRVMTLKRSRFMMVLLWIRNRSGSVSLVLWQAAMFLPQCSVVFKIRGMVEARSGGGDGGVEVLALGLFEEEHPWENLTGVKIGASRERKVVNSVVAEGGVIIAMMWESGAFPLPSLLGGIA